MTDTLTQRPVALVTGGRRGIGKAVALELAAAGFDLAITGQTEDAESQAAVEAIRGHGAEGLFVPGDLADLAGHRATLDAVIERFGRIDCLVNNAGIASPVRGDLLELAPENFDRVLSVNLRGAFFFTQAVAAWMIANPAADGRTRSIVNVSSVSAALASPERADYCISKAGVGMMTRLFALRLAANGIGVFEVRPGIIRTDMTSGVSSRYDTLIADGLVPMRRWGEGSDIGRAVAALAGGGFAFATGSVIDADGGLSIPRL